MRRILLVPLRLIGSALRAILVGVLAVAMIAGGVAFADYTATQGSGTTFASVVIATKHYMAMVVCDMTVGETQCDTVKAASTAAAQTDTALVERNPDLGTIGDSAYAGSGNATVVAALKGVYAAVSGAISAGTNVIGGVFGSANVTPTDCSGSITTGGTAQTLIAAASTIHGFQVANLGGTDTLWFSLTTTAAATTGGSYPLIPLATTGSGSYATPFGFGTNHAVSIIGATTGDKFSCTSW